MTNEDDDDLLFFADEEEQDEGSDENQSTDGKWRLLVVDDEEDVHDVTRLALSDFKHSGQPLEFLHAHSGAEAKAILEKEKDIALILLDVIMETDHAGLDVARYLRDELHNHKTRVVLRTGQPGQAPEREVITQYDVNDYKTKTELTTDRLFTVVYTALSSYAQLVALEKQKIELDHQAKQLEDSNRELEEFAYVASHDLQTPLRGIIGFAQLLLKRKGDSLDDESKELLDLIVEGTGNMQALVRDLLAYSRVGRVDASKTIIDTESLVEDVVDRLLVQVEETNAQIQYGQLPDLHGSTQQILQLFQNLLGNSLRYRKKDTRPEIRIEAEQKDDDRVHFTVSDNGIGMDPAHTDRIFKMFQRLHTADEFPGNGIGLAICQKVVNYHDGEISVETAPNEGATFRFSLPAVV